MQRHLAAEDGGRTIGLIVVRERTAALHRVLHVRKRRRRIVVLVIASADAEREPISRRNHDARGPDLDVELHRHAGLERLLLIVRVPRPVRQALRPVDLAVRGAQPALSDRRLGIERSLEQQLLPGGLEDAQDDEEIGVAGRRRSKQLEHGWAGNLHFLLDEHGEGEPVALRRRERIVAERLRRSRRLARQARAVRVEIKARPLRAGERPFVLVAQDELLPRVAHLELHARLPVPAVALPLQEIAEEALLQFDAVVRIERRPVRPAVDFQPLVVGGGAHETFEVAARVQALAAPIGGREERYLHLREIGGALDVVVVDPLAREERLPHAPAVSRQLFLAQRLGPANQLAGVRVLLATLADAVLHGLHLHVLPVLAEAADDAAVPRAFAIRVVPALPDADRREVRRLHGGRTPLVARVIRDAVHADLAAAPGLRGGPFDAFVDVARLAGVVVAEKAGRAAGAARVDADADVALWHPLLGIDHFPVLVAVGRAAHGVEVLARHDLPGALVALLEREAFAVGAVG